MESKGKGRELRFLVEGVEGEVWVPVGPEVPGQACGELVVRGGEVVDCIRSEETGQGAWVLRADGGAALAVRYPFRLTGGEVGEGVLRPGVSPRLRAGPSLRELAGKLAPEGMEEGERLERVLGHVSSRFNYGHPESRPEPDGEGVAALACGLTPGSCVDIHCYAVALLWAAGFEAAYVAGLFVRAGRPVDKPLRPGHCWVLLRRGDGRLEYYDIAQHLQFGLPGTAREGLNPVPGERVALQIGYEHRFARGGREARVGRLLWPSALGEDGVLRSLDTRVEGGKGGKERMKDEGGSLKEGSL